MIHGSIFHNVRDKQPVALPPVSFAELIDALSSESYECDPCDKGEQTCISPAIYNPGETRSKAGALSWDWFAADIDNKLGNLPGSTIDDIIRVMRDLGSPWFIYTTASSLPGAECFRLMFPLDRPIMNCDFGDAWQAFSCLLPMDTQTKDISRLFIVPRRWAGRENRVAFDLAGTPVSVNEIVARFPTPKRVPLTTALPRAAAMSPSKINNKRIVMPSLAAPYVTRRSVSQALASPPGGRMYRFLVAVAFSAKRKSYEVGPDDLETIGDELAAMMGRSRNDIRRDAQSAHRYAEQHYSEDRAARFSRMQTALRPKSFGEH